MTDTRALITGLVTQARPVRRLPHPLWRAALWLALAIIILGLLAVEHGMRPDLIRQLHSGDFALSLCASFITAALAAIACMMASLPDRSRFWLLLPLPALTIWLSGTGYGCLTHWVAFDAGRVQQGEALRCFATLLLVSLPLSGTMLVMLRHASRLRPAGVILTAGLAVGAMAATAMSLLHQLDATLMVVLWNVGAAALIAGIEAAFGRRALAWCARVLTA